MWTGVKKNNHVCNQPSLLNLQTLVFNIKLTVSQIILSVKFVCGRLLHPNNCFYLKRDSFGHSNTSHSLKPGLPRISHCKIYKHSVVCGKDMVADKRFFKKWQCLSSKKI